MEINIDKSQVIIIKDLLNTQCTVRVSRSNESLQINVNNRELKVVVHFKYLRSVLTRDGYCTKEIKMRIAIPREAFNRKMSLLTSKLNIEVRKKLVRCYVRIIALYG